MKERTKNKVTGSRLGLALILAFMLCFAGCQSKEAATPTTQAELTETKAETASLTVSCTTLLDEMDKVPANKKEYVPANGIILSKDGVEIKEGDTAFSFLQRLCSENNIQMSYVEGMIYVTSVGNLNEKDCGAESGWMYKVNGESPTVGAAEYKLKNGDKIEFLYITSYAQAF